MTDILLYFKHLVDSLNAQYPALPWAFLLVFFGGYFIVFRGRIGHRFAIKEKRRNKKECNQNIDETVDMVFSKPNKRTFKRIVNWMLCKCYSDEQKGKHYTVFVFTNYLYLALALLCVVMWPVAWFALSLRWWLALVMLIWVCMNGCILLVSAVSAFVERITYLKRKIS